MRTSVVASPPTTTERPRPQQFGDAAALIFRRRVKIVDRLARTLISVSGIGIIFAVLGIGVFLFLEIFPIFQPAKIEDVSTRSVLPTSEVARLVVVDEHQERALIVGTQPVVRLTSLTHDTVERAWPLEGLAGQQITAVSRTLREPVVALGTDQGAVWLGTLAFETVFEGSQRTIQPIIKHEALLYATPGYRISQLAYRTFETGSVVATAIDNGELILTRIVTHRPLLGPTHREQISMVVPLDRQNHVTALLINEAGTQVLAGFQNGTIARWSLRADDRAELLETIQAVPSGAVSEMVYLLGGRSIAVGGSDGSVTTWSLVREESMADGWRLTRLHVFPNHTSPVTLITASPRDKGFISIARDGTARLHYMTSERTLAQWTLTDTPTAGTFAPKTNGAVVIDQMGRLHHWRIHNPHPEVSWSALFGKVWYEGYERPEYTWQSTGGADDFESKFSLVPLLFGTLKGTCYALLFAIPLALFGALYCSQFLEKRLRNGVKSTVELMAALPSVVLGFVAGVVLAPLVQDHLVAVLAMPILVPVVAIGGVMATRTITIPWVNTLVRRHEFWMLTAWVVIGMITAICLGPTLEHVLFRGQFEPWLLQTTGIRYDQRNALVVGWAMGFAVIPLIFTICEDAFSAVPKHLVGASLACGASAWQTAWRIVLPAAGSGVFSAVMVGFGRAIGETMIVLMATGNTPTMDWSIFNGFRALSANIAVEIPEAPYGGTLYRVLFIAALLLFSLTFLVNTVAELVRLRLRRQLQGL